MSTLRSRNPRQKEIEVEVHANLYRWIQTAVVRSPSDLLQAVEFGKLLAEELTERHETHVEFSVDLFGTHGKRVYWQTEFVSLDGIQAMKDVLAEDEEYISSIEANKDLWKEGSFTESVITVITEYAAEA